VPDPSSDSPDTPTVELLRLAAAGEESAREDLATHLYSELRTLAERQLRRERSDHTLQATALVHEAFLRLVDTAVLDVQGRAHFFAIAARVMRNVLVDHARRRGAQKRGGDRLRVTLDEVLAGHEDRGLDVLALNESLERLAALDGRKARVVELRFFGGLTAKETAAVLQLSPKTVEADWYMARAWLRNELA
jgi:RNA polymerase sigma factor (TIGR02999 family)